MTEAPQAQWLWPRGQRRSKKKGPQEATRPSGSQTTSGRPDVGTSCAQSSSTAGFTSRSSQAGHQAPPRRREAKRLPSSSAPIHLPLPRASVTPRPQNPLLRTTRTTSRQKLLPRMTWTTTKARAVGGTLARQGPPRAATAPWARPVNPRRGRTRTTRPIVLATGPDRPRRPLKAGVLPRMTGRQ